MFANLKSSLNSLLPRMSGWFAIVLLLMVAVWLLAPHQLGVSVYKLSLVTLAAVVGYWLDRSLFPYARPHHFHQYLVAAKNQNPNANLDIGMVDVYTNSTIRRAIIIAAAMIAVSLGA